VIELGAEPLFPGPRLVFLMLLTIPLMNWFNRNWFSLFCGCITLPFNELPEKGKTKFTLFLLVWVLGCMIVTGKVPHVPKL